MNKIIFGLSIIASTGLGYWAGKNNLITYIDVPSSIVFESETPLTSPIEKELQVISPKEISQHDLAESVAHKSSLAPEKLTPDPSSQQQIDAIKAQYEFEQRSAKFTDWLTKNQKDKPWFDLGVEMNGRFAAEETDYSWATAEEGSLQALFIQDPALAGIALKSTSCKSTQCQITVSVMDQDHANETAMAISKVIGSHKATQIIIDNKVKQSEAIFYVSRNEKGFELN